MPEQSQRLSCEWVSDRGYDAPILGGGLQVFLHTGNGKALFYIKPKLVFYLLSKFPNCMDFFVSSFPPLKFISFPYAGTLEKSDRLHMLPFHGRFASLEAFLGPTAIVRFRFQIHPAVSVFFFLHISISQLIIGTISNPFIFANTYLLPAS